MRGRPRRWPRVDNWLGARRGECNEKLTAQAVSDNDDFEKHATAGSEKEA